MKHQRLFSTVLLSFALATACGNGNGDGDKQMTEPTGGAGAGGGGSGGPPGCSQEPGADTGAVSVAFEQNVTVTTIAGGATEGDLDGPGATAQFANPVSVIVEPTGSVVVCDFDNDRLRRIGLDGAVSTLTHQYNFQRPYGMALDAAGTLYVDTDYNPAGVKSNTTGTIWKVDRSSGLAVVVAADLGRPRGLAVRGDGRLVLADYQNSRVRLLDPGTQAVEDLVRADACAVDLAGGTTEPPFTVPYGVVVMPNQTIVVTDSDRHELRSIAGGAVGTFAGANEGGTVDGPALSARFARPTAMAMDAAGNIYISDTVAHRIRRVAADGTVTTIAGNGTAGYRDGAGADAQFFGQEGIAVTSDGHTIFVADGSGGEADLPYHRVRKIVVGGAGSVVTP
jgi:sugar lactone lactonase YvrE